MVEVSSRQRSGPLSATLATLVALSTTLTLALVTTDAVAADPSSPMSLAAATAPTTVAAPTPIPVAAPASSPVASPVPTPMIRPAVAPWSDGRARVLPDARIVGVDPIPAGRNRVLAQVSLYRDRGNAKASFSATGYAALSDNGTLGPLHVPTSRLMSGPVFDDAGRGYVLAARGRSFGWATFSADGRMGTVHVLGRSTNTSPEIAVDAAGNLAVAWIDFNTPREDRETLGTRTRLRVALRPVRGAFRRTETLPLAPSYDQTDITVAIAEGRVVVGAAQVPANQPSGLTTWTGTVRAGLGARRFVGRLASQTTLTSTIDARGLAVIVAATQSVGEEVSSGLRVRVASRAPGAARFGALRQLDPGGRNEEVGASAAVVADPGGGATLAWHNLRGERKDASLEVSVATVDAGGRISPRRAIAGDAALIGLSASPSGVIAVAWRRTDDATFAAYRRGIASTFGAPEPLPSGTDASSSPLFRPGSEQLVRIVLTPPAAPNGAPSLSLARRAKGF